MRLTYYPQTFLIGVIWLTSQATAVAAPPGALVLQAPPPTSVDSVAVSPDGLLVATAVGEGGVRLYDARNGALLRTIGAAGDRGVSFSPDGRTLLAAGFHMDKLFGIFDVQTGSRKRALAGHTEWEVYAAAVSPDGKLLASAGTDKQILVWELATGKLRHQIQDQVIPASALAFSPDSATLASGGGDKLVRLWDCESGKLRRSLAGHGEWICSLAFSPDGKSIASGACDWGFHRGARLATAGRERPGEVRVEAVGGCLGHTVANRGRKGGACCRWLLLPAANPSPAALARTCGCTITRWKVRAES